MKITVILLLIILFKVIVDIVLYIKIERRVVKLEQYSQIKYGLLGDTRLLERLNKLEGMMDILYDSVKKEKQ